MAIQTGGGLTYTFRHGMLLLKPTSSPLNLNMVPLDSKQLMFGAGRHSTKTIKKKEELTSMKHLDSNKQTKKQSVHMERSCTQKQITIVYLPHATRSLQFSGS